MWRRADPHIKTASLKGLITSGLSGLIAGAHANCERAEFSTRTAKPREKEEKKDGRRRKRVGGRQRRKEKEWGEERINRDIQRWRWRTA